MSDHFDALAKSYESDLSLVRCEYAELQGKYTKLQKDFEEVSDAEAWANESEGQIKRELYYYKNTPEHKRHERDKELWSKNDQERRAFYAPLYEDLQQARKDLFNLTNNMNLLNTDYEATLNALGFKEEADTVDVIDRIARLLEAERDLEEMRQCVCE